MCEPKAGGIEVEDMKLLDSHEATGTESSYTFTPATPFTNTEYSQIIVIITGRSTASLAIEMVINALTTKYYSEKVQISSGTLSGVSHANLSEWELCPTTIITTSSMFSIRVEIHIPDASMTSEKLEGHVRATGQVQIIQQGGILNDNSNENDISSIKVQTSTSTWATGTTIHTYGLKV